MIFMAHGIDNATLTLDAGTAHASYPLDNLLSRVIGKQFRTANGSATTIQIEFDFGANRTCDSIIVANTNYDVDEGGTLFVGAADNGADYDVELLDAYTFSTGNVWSFYTTFTETTKRYWRLTLTSFAANAADYIGQIFLGMRYETPYNSDYNFNKGFQYGIQSNPTRGGVDLRYKNHAKKYVEQQLKFHGFTDAQATAFLTYFNDSEKCDGILKPFFFIPDGETTDAPYAYFNNQQLVFNRVVADFNEITLNIEQQL